MGHPGTFEFAEPQLQEKVDKLKSTLSQNLFQDTMVPQLTSGNLSATVMCSVQPAVVCLAISSCSIHILKFS